jgi:hypothetical protein
MWKALAQRRRLRRVSLCLYYKWQNALFDVQRSMFDVRRSSFICSQGVDYSLKYVESEFTPGQEP